MLGSLNNDVLLRKDVSSFHFTSFIVSPSYSCPLWGRVLAGTKFLDISDVKYVGIQSMQVVPDISGRRQKSWLF